MTKPNWVLLALVAIVGVFVFQWRALFAGWHSFDLTIDIVGMQRGYEFAQLHGNAQWWTSKWINFDAYNYYPPLVSYFHYFQFWMLGRVPFWITSAISMVLYITVVFSASVLAFRLTNRAWMAYATAILLAAFNANGDGVWLAYFPYADNLFCILFQLLSLLCFYQFLRDQRHRWLVLAWCGFLASGLCKEQGWITPLLMGAMVLLFPVSRRLQIAYYSHAALMCIAAGVLIKYGRAVIGAKGVLRWPIQNVWINTLLHGQWWLSLIGFSIMGAMVVAFIYRRALNTPIRRFAALGGLAAVVYAALLLAPTNELPHGVYAMVYIADRAANLAWGGVYLMLYSAMAWLIFKFRHERVVVFLLCLLIAEIPARALGTVLVSSRAVFALPYMAILGLTVFDIVLCYFKALAPNAAIESSAAPICSAVPERNPM